MNTGANHGHQRPKLEEYGDRLFGYPLALTVIAGALGVLFFRFRRLGWL